MHPRRVQDRVSAAGAAGHRQGAGVPAPGRGGGADHVGGAALGRSAPLYEAAARVRVLLRFQGGGGEVGGQPLQLVGSRLMAAIVQLQRDQSERGEGRVKDRKTTQKKKKYVFLRLHPHTNI